MVKILNYKGYSITEENNRITVDGIKDFNPVHIFECGQCFRFYYARENRIGAG